MDPGDEDSVDEGFSLLLGGVAMSDLSSMVWDAVEDSSVSSASDSSPDKVSVGPHGVAEALCLEKKTQNSSEREVRKNALFQHKKIPVPEKDHFDNAFHCRPNGSYVQPPIRIVDMSSVNKGYALIASRFIARGEIIFTEQAAEATQVPQTCLQCSTDSKEIQAEKTYGQWMSPLFNVRACQNCFRSLEPASSCSILPATSDKSSDLSTSTTPCPSLPMPHLWPIAEYAENLDREPDGTGACYVQDKHRRVQCQKCRSMFCSPTCRTAHNARMGSCCLCNTSVTAAVHALFCQHGISGNAQESTSADEMSIDENPHHIQPAVVLAARMLCLEVHLYRKQTPLDNWTGPFDDMCGDPDDIPALELGMKTTESVTLGPAYSAICEALAMNDIERKVFPLSAFNRLASIAARNAFCVATKSPFQSYHSALLRHVGGRGSDGHQKAMKDVALALGSADGILQRDMDRKVAEKCAAEVVALFKLTARINHSCDPCAEVRGQEFMDCRIDLVSKRDIEPGEEITISYINVGKTAGRPSDKARRIRELKARYLFTCDCHRCTNNDK